MASREKPKAKQKNMYCFRAFKSNIDHQTSSSLDRFAKSYFLSFPLGDSLPTSALGARSSAPGMERWLQERRTPGTALRDLTASSSCLVGSPQAFTGTCPGERLERASKFGVKGENKKGAGCMHVCACVCV